MVDTAYLVGDILWKVAFRIVNDIKEQPDDDLVAFCLICMQVKGRGDESIA